MNLRSQRGATLAEAAVCIAVVSLAAGGLLSALLPAAHSLNAGVRKAALAQAADREVRTARDILKYDGSTLAPATVATTLPLPDASPMPVTLQLAVDESGGAVAIVVTASADGGAPNAQARATIAARAPQPGRTYAPAGLVAAPTGAP